MKPEPTPCARSVYFPWVVGGGYNLVYTWSHTTISFILIPSYGTSNHNKMKADTTLLSPLMPTIMTTFIINPQSNKFLTKPLTNPPVGVISQPTHTDPISPSLPPPPSTTVGKPLCYRLLSMISISISISISLSFDLSRHNRVLSEAVIRY